MPTRRPNSDYEALAPYRRQPRRDEEEITRVGRASSEPLAGDEEFSWDAGNNGTHTNSRGVADSASAATATAPETRAPKPRLERWQTRRGHLFSYFGLFLFTFILYFRPYEQFSALASFTSMAFWAGLLTLAVFLPTQLTLEGTLTARPREVNLVLLLCVAALLSMPLAISPGDAWNAFIDPFIKVVLMFIVIVNSVRTMPRLRWMMYLGLAVSCVLSVNALQDYRAGRFTVEGYRVAGTIGNMFENPNDLAVHLGTMIPIALALMFSARGLLRKIPYLACAALLVGATVVTFSRGGFLGMTAAALVLAWKIGRRNRFAVIALMLLAAVSLLVLAPGNYANRLLSIYDSSRDAVGSSTARRELLWRSIYTSLMNPLFGIGMGNFHIVSIREAPSHNSYTQVSAELGMAAMVIYTMFIVTPIRRLRQIERATFAARRGSQFYYLAAGLQASLVSYMVSSFFGSVAFQWYVYYLVGYAIALRRIYATSDDVESSDLAIQQPRPEPPDTAATPPADVLYDPATAQIVSRRPVVTADPA